MTPALKFNECKTKQTALNRVHIFATPFQNRRSAVIGEPQAVRVNGV